nr:retrovirus-related Pol polyprotein from transposon TNT 1-94 [Tanacetum cinerariifolium]
MHQIEQVFGDPSKPVQTRCRLRTDAELCMYALIVSTTEPKNIKEVMLDQSWIESMQDELNQFKQLDVWELVKLPADENVIKVKWLWKNKTCAKNMVIQNKSRLVAKGYIQQEGIDIEESFAPKPPVYNSDDDVDFFRESIDETPPSNAIVPDLPIMDSLVIKDEHLDTIPETVSDEEIESSVKNLNLTLSESEDFSDYVSECDLPFCDNSLDFNNDFEIFSNPLFDSKDDYTSSDDESSFEEMFREINPLYNEVLEDLDPILPGNENDHFNAESNLIESLLNKDTVIISPKIDFLLEEFTGELALINPIPPGIAETNFDSMENICHIKKLLYDNLSPRPLKGLNPENDFEKENSGSTTIHTYISLIEYESFYDESDSASKIFNDDLAHIISPSECEYVYADDESDSGDLTTKVMDDISDNSTRELCVYMPNVLTTLYPMFDTLLPLLSENKDKVFNPGILISKEEKSHPLLSHRGVKVFQLINDSESPMMIYGGDIPILDVLYLHFYPP